MKILVSLKYRRPKTVKGGHHDQGEGIKQGGGGHAPKPIRLADKMRKAPLTTTLGVIVKKKKNGKY